jgi:hypothetical protein
MDESYDFFPLMLDSPVESQAFDLFHPGDLSDCADVPWSRKWLAGKYNGPQMLIELASLGNADISTFAVEFFRSYAFAGVVRLKQGYRDKFRPHSWVAFKRRESTPTTSPSVAEMISVLPGEYCYMPERDLDNICEIAEQDTVNLFFQIFGNLRDSFPFFGGDYFPPRPRRKEEQFFLNRNILEEIWIDSATIYVRGNLDYFLLSLDGAVGYMPIEGERRIAKIANSFGDFLVYWVNEDRRKYYDMRLEMIRAERFG